MSIDINRLGPAAREQVRRQLEEQKRKKATGMVGADLSTPLRSAQDDGRGNKLNAVRTDGYASKHEAERAAELRWMEKAGKIRDLREQVKYELIPAQWEEIPRFGKKGQPIKPKRKCVERALCYFADFVYVDCATGETIVEDAKGYKGGATYRVFKDKAKMMLDKYGIKVVEV